MIELLQQSAGFLIQTLPIAFIFFAAFGREKLHLGGRGLYLTIGSALFVFAMMFTGIMGAFSQAGYDQGEIQRWADMYFSGVLVLGVVLALINVKERLCKRFLVLLLVIYYAAMIYSFSTLLVFRFFPQVLPAIYPYSSYNLMLLGIFTILTFPVLYWFMGVRMREILEVVDAARIIRACIYVAVELVLYVIFLNLSGGNWLSMNFYMLVCYCISNIIMMYMFFSEIQMAWKSAVMEEKLRIFELKYQSIDNSIQETQRFRHDLRHHLGIISTLNSQGSKEELSAYLNKYIRVYEGLEEEILCDYPLVNTILKYYIERAVRENIRVTNNIICLLYTSDAADEL